MAITVTGIIVEKKDENRVRVKFLGVPGETGPEFNIEKSTAIELNKLLTDHLETGDDVEINFVTKSLTRW